MGDSGIKPSLCESLDKALIRREWKKWLRSVELYLATEEIVNPLKKRNKVLHMGAMQLQKVSYNLPAAIEAYDESKNNDVYTILIKKLTDYFSPVQNSTFERHAFRNIIRAENEAFSKFLLRIREQASKCTFGSTKQESKEIILKDKLIDCWATMELKKKLLEKERSLEEIIELCKIYEQTGQQSKAMDCNQPGPSLVNKISWPHKQSQIQD